MTDWPEDFGVVEVGDSSWIVSLETLAQLRAAIARREEWADFTTLHGVAYRVRVTRIDGSYTNSRESRRLDHEHAAHLEKEKRQDVPDWEEAG